MYVAAILKLWNFNGEDIISDHEFLLPILNASTVLTNVLEGSWLMQKSFQKLLKWLQYRFTYRVCWSNVLAYLTGTFQNQVNLVLYIKVILY